MSARSSRSTSTRRARVSTPAKPLPILWIAGLGLGAAALLYAFTRRGGTAAGVPAQIAAQNQFNAIQNQMNGGGGGPIAGLPNFGNGGVFNGAPVPVSTSDLLIAPSSLSVGQPFITSTAGATTAHPNIGKYVVTQSPDPGGTTVQAQNLDTNAIETIPISAITALFGNT